jgi:hypothetical protein
MVCVLSLTAPLTRLTVLTSHAEALNQLTIVRAARLWSGSSKSTVVLHLKEVAVDAERLGVISMY